MIKIAVEYKKFTSSPHITFTLLYQFPTNKWVIFSYDALQLRLYTNKDYRHKLHR